MGSFWAENWKQAISCKPKKLCMREFLPNALKQSANLAHARNFHSARNCSALLASCTSGFLIFMEINPDPLCMD